MIPTFYFSAASIRASFLLVRTRWPILAPGVPVEDQLLGVQRFRTQNWCVWFQKYPCRSSMAREGFHISYNVSSCWNTIIRQCDAQVLLVSLRICNVHEPLGHREARTKGTCFRNCQRMCSNLFHPSFMSIMFILIISYFTSIILYQFISYYIILISNHIFCLSFGIVLPSRPFRLREKV